MFFISIDVGTKNLAYVVVNSETNEICEWEVVSVPLTSLSKTVSFLDELFKNKNKIFNESNTSTVLVEKQPSRNVKMRIMENTLLMYFEMSKISRVISYSAKYKLGEIGKTVKGRHNYSLRKKYSILMTKQYLASNVFLLDFFEKHKKKDDLADCLLQYISHTDMVRIDELSKIICSL